MNLPYRTFYVLRDHSYFFVWGTHWRDMNRIADAFDPNWIASFGDDLFFPDLFKMCLGEVK